MAAIMNLLASESSRLRFESYIEDLASVIGHADRVVPLHDYCTGLLLPAAAWRSEKRRAHGRADRAGADSAETPVAAAFRGPGAVVRSGRADQSAPDRAARHRGARRDRGVDHR